MGVLNVFKAQGCLYAIFLALVLFILVRAERSVLWVAVVVYECMAMEKLPVFSFQHGLFLVENGTPGNASD